MTLAQLGALICMFGGTPNDIQWSGVSHVQWQDCRPLVPVDHQAFSILFQTYQFDVDSARVRFEDGINPQWINAVFDHDRGPYAVWRADLPATAANTLSYYIELTDGTDVDYYGPTGMSDGPPASGFVVDFATYSHVKPGSWRLADGSTLFKVWAPHPSSASVAGQFNNWSTGANPMTRTGDYFYARVGGTQDRQMYKYVFQPNTNWRPDARARSLNPGDNYNTHIENPFRYTWVSTDFATPAFADMILYELHVGTFAGRNDPEASGAIPATYRDVAAHAEHLAELGVTAVELMPITEFPWDFSAGYNPVSAWAPEWRHGTPDDLKYMIDVLHQHGIAVLLDICWNHFSPSDNYLWEYDGTVAQYGDNLYFREPNLETPWGSQADFGRTEVREYFLESALYWLEEFRVDGFRMDATEYMNLAPYEADGWSLMQAFNNQIDNRWIDKISIAEQLPDDPWVTRPTSLGGAGFDSQWNDAFTDALRQEIIDAALGDPEMWRIADVLEGSGQYLEQTYVVNYLELHDEAWPSSGGQRLVKTIDPTFPHDDAYAKGRIKLAQGVVFTAPGIPMMLQGSEWLEYTDFGGGSPAGADRINWALKTTYAPIFQYFKDLIAVRKTNGALRADAGVDPYHVNEGGNVIAYHRWDLSGNEIVVVANFSNNNYTNYQLGFPYDGVWYELLNSQALEYDGNGMGNGGSVTTTGGAYDGFPQSAFLTIPQMGLLVLRYNDAPGEPCPEDIDGNGQIDLADLSALLTNYGLSGAGLEGDIDGDNDVDLADLSALLSAFGTACP
jgi:1,4-alpha-glucan branching enzyme